MATSLFSVLSRRCPLPGTPALVFQYLDEVDEHGAGGQLDTEPLDRG